MIIAKGLVYKLLAVHLYNIYVNMTVIVGFEPYSLLTT